MAVIDKDNSRENKDVTITDENAADIKIKLSFLRHIAIESKLKFGFGVLFCYYLHNFHSEYLWP